MKRKILSLIITACVFILPLSVFASAVGDSNTIFNDAFFVELDDGDYLSFIYEDKYNEAYGTAYTYEIADEDIVGKYEYIYISVLENKIGLDNIEEDSQELTKFVYSLVSSFVFIENPQEIFTQKASEMNGYSCIEYSGKDVTDEGTMYEETYYYKVYAFATEERLYTIILETTSENFKFANKLLKSFTMNGTLLNGGSHKNKVDFTEAESYLEQYKKFSEEFNFSVIDESTNTGVKIVFFILSLPFIIVVIVAIIYIVKYFKNKKILEQYEKTFGVMGMGIPLYMNNSYMPPMQNNTQPINPNYPNQNGNNGENNF